MSFAVFKKFYFISEDTKGAISKIYKSNQKIEIELQSGNTKIEMLCGNRELELPDNRDEGLEGSEEKLKQLQEKVINSTRDAAISNSIFKKAKDIHQEPEAILKFRSSTKESENKVSNTDYLSRNYFFSTETPLDRLLVETNKNNGKNQIQDFSRGTSSINEMLDNVRPGAPCDAISNINTLLEASKLKIQRNIFDLAERIPTKISNQKVGGYNKNRPLKGDVCLVKSNKEPEFELQSDNREIEMLCGDGELELPDNRDKDLELKLKVVGSEKKLKQLHEKVINLPQNIAISNSIFKKAKGIHQEPEAILKVRNFIEETRNKVSNTDYLSMDYFVSIETFLDRLLVETNKNNVKNQIQDFSRETSSIDEMLDNIKSGAPFAAILNIDKLLEDSQLKIQRNVFDVAEKISIRIPNVIVRGYNKNSTWKGNVCLAKLSEPSWISLFRIRNHQLKEEKIVNIKNQELFLPFLDVYKSKRHCMFKVLYDTLSILVYTNPKHPNFIYVSFFSHPELKSLGYNEFIESNMNLSAFLHPNLDLARNRNSYQKFLDRVTNLYGFTGGKYLEKYLNFREKEELNGKLINEIYNYYKYKGPTAFEHFMNSCENYLIVDGIAKIYFRKDIPNELKEEVLKKRERKRSSLVEDIQCQVKKVRKFKSIYQAINDGKEILDDQQFMSVILERKREFIQSLPPKLVSYLTEADLGKKKITFEDRYTFSPRHLEKVMLFSKRESIAELVSNIKREPIDPVTFNKKSSKTIFYNPDMAYKINNDERVLKARQKEVEYLELLKRSKSSEELIQIYDEIFDIERSICILYDTIKKCIGQIMSKVNKETYADEKIKVTTKIFEEHDRGLKKEKRISVIKKLLRIVDLRFRAKEIIQDEIQESHLEKILEFRRIIDDIEKEYAGYRSCVLAPLMKLYASDIKSNTKYFSFSSFNFGNFENIPERFCWTPKNNLFYVQANMMRDLVFPIVFLSVKTEAFTLYKNDNDIIGYVNFTFRGGKDFYIFIEEKKGTYSFKGNRVYLNYCVSDAKKWFLIEFESIYYEYANLHYYEVLDFNERLSYSKKKKKELTQLRSKYKTQCILISRYGLEDIKKKYQEYNLDTKELEKLKEVIPKKTESGIWIFENEPRI